MSSRKSVSLATAAAFAITTVMFPVYGSAARDRAGVTTEFSADNQDKKDQKQQNQQQKQQQKQQNQQFKQQQHNTQQQQNQQFKQQNQQFKQQQKVQTQQFKEQKKTLEQTNKQERTLQKKETNQLKFDTKQAQKREFIRSGNNAVVVGGKLRGVNGAAQFSMGGRNYSSWHGGGHWRHQGHDGRWETFVALSALGVLAIGAYEYYPYAYIDAPRPYCEGMTEDGCQLDFQDVQTQEGYVVGQCVAYCPWQQ